MVTLILARMVEFVNMGCQDFWLLNNGEKADFGYGFGGKVGGIVGI